MLIEDSVALVTGANRGLGLAFARALLARGARKVYAGAREPSSIALPEAGAREVLADAISQQVKGGLSAHQAPYLGAP
jgi:NAD(P)-dependent dehydrogenase (short-subunit alcohol dehydrogenase family)